VTFEFFELLLKSVGVTLTELQDVVFRLAYFDRRYTFYSSPQLQAEVQSHYTKQFIKQLYVLVLGLDIIGNPFGLVRDLSSGVEDLFYQPFQGAIQGPEEFAEGLALGVSSLFGHAVGGAAGAVSRITGTLGKGVAALTLDADYQRKRQEALNRQPQNFGEGITRAGENLTQGVVDGITGVFTKPIEGARQGGVVGFTKGIGKGLIGAVTRPASGLVDFASGSLNAVKTVASNAEDAQHVRPARVVQSDLIVRPYNYSDAFGAKIFGATDR
ncbi:UNVERIFIED_CONTAM: Vacuolar protein sorting-associated protein 13, partial [Eudyptes robustus]